MSNARESAINQVSIAEYVVIGGGPAAICALAKIYGSRVPGNKIIWIDPHFKVGDFGTKLSVGSSVPGNTAVESYQKVNHAIYAMIPECSPSSEEKARFEISSLASSVTCSLKIAAQPMQYITDKLRKLVSSIAGTVLAIKETKDGIQLEIKSADGITHAMAKRVILAIGAEPRTLHLPDEITIINPNIAFIESKLDQYLKENPAVKTLAVIGSSHSAALAVMHLLKVRADIMVRQFMNKKYKFATPVVASDGTRYTQFDNTGLKGEVATFTSQLLNDARIGQGVYAKRWKYYVGEDVDALLNTHLSGCTHAVVSIGYTPSCSLQINGLPISKFKHDRQTTQMIDISGRHIPGVYGIGVAYPLEEKTISGEVEFAVGVGKFWFSINDKILFEWNKRSAGTAVFSLTSASQYTVPTAFQVEKII